MRITLFHLFDQCFIFSLVFFTTLIYDVDSRSINVVTREGQWEYLVTYEHAAKLPDGVQPSDEKFKIGVEDFQRYFHLQVTGKVDAESMRIMQQPRCGSGDKNLPFGKFALSGNRWKKDEVTWQLRAIDSNANYDQVAAVIRESMDTWQPHIPIKLTEVTDGSTPDIIIDFLRPDSSGRHGDEYPFNTATIAHAFYPGTYEISGDIHFNLMKSFSYTNNPDSVSYSAKLIGVHELGHSLGLDHSENADAVMYPLMKKGTPFEKLSIDDVVGIFARYDPNFIWNKSSHGMYSLYLLCFSVIVNCILYYVV